MLREILAEETHWWLRLFGVSQEPLANTVQIMGEALDYEPPRGGGPAE